MRTLIAIVALAVVLGGCGNKKTDHTASDYAIAVQGAQFRFANEFDAARTKLESSANAKTDARALRQAADAVTKDVKTLRRINPPAKVKALHHRLVTLMESYGKQVDKAAHFVANGDPGQFVHAKNLLSRSTDTITMDFNNIIDDINNKLS
jgi:hypothetical protein